MGDNREIKIDTVLENLENIGVSKVEINGSCNEFIPGVKKNGNEASVSVSSPPVATNSEVFVSPGTTRKGYGLKKWRRIKRDVTRSGESSEDNGNMAIHELSNSVVKPSKRAQVYAERQQKSEGSVSSAYPVVGSLDVFNDSCFAVGPAADAGTDSENSEDRSSKSSTAASVPKIKYDQSKMRSLSGKNLTHSAQRGQQGKSRVEPTKKAKGERVKIEKENSLSSMESDLRSSNFVFAQGSYANGIRGEGLVHHDGENGHGVRGSEEQFGDGLRDGYGRDSEEGQFGELSWDGKNERSEKNGPSLDQDPLVESIFLLQTAQEALEEELLKLKELGKDASADGSEDFTDLENQNSEHFPSGAGVPSFSQTSQPEVVEIANRDLEKELEDLFKQRIEAEVEYLAISKTIQKLRVTVVDQSAILEEQKSTASELTQDKLGDKATMFKKDSEKLQTLIEHVASADETLKLQKKVCKYTSFLLLQILSLFIIIGVFMFHFSPNYVEVVPT